MNFGARLAEERKRLGLRQAEFANLVGTDVPKQSLYENGRRELRADYIARLPEAGVDIVYVLTGNRGEGGALDAGASELLSAYLTLSPRLQEALRDLAAAMNEEGQDRPRTLHARRADYRAE